jgi:hypothetical protein
LSSFVLAIAPTAFPVEYQSISRCGEIGARLLNGLGKSRFSFPAQMKPRADGVFINVKVLERNTL